MVHRREREVLSPHDDALRALSSELDQLKTNLAVLGTLPGHGHLPAMEQLHGRLVAVILEVTRLQQLQPKHVTRLKYQTTDNYNQHLQNYQTMEQNQNPIALPWLKLN